MLKFLKKLLGFPPPIDDFAKGVSEDLPGYALIRSRKINPTGTVCSECIFNKPSTYCMSSESNVRQETAENCPTMIKRFK